MSTVLLVVLARGPANIHSQHWCSVLRYRRHYRLHLVRQVACRHVAVKRRIGLFLISSFRACASNCTTSRNAPLRLRRHLGARFYFRFALRSLTVWRRGRGAMLSLYPASLHPMFAIRSRMSSTSTS